jgi:hypothetical protein
LILFIRFLFNLLNLTTFDKKLYIKLGQKFYMRKIKTIINHYYIHTFLIIPYLIFYIALNNHFQVFPYMFWRPLLIGFLGTCVLFFTLKLLLKDNLKAAIFSTCIVFIFISFISRSLALEQFFNALNFPITVSYKILLITDFVLIIIVFYILKKLKKSLIPLNAFLNVTFILLVFYNLFSYIVVYKTKTYRPYEKDALFQIKKIPENLPNIYYIVLDGYANNIVLNKYYNFDNSDFLNSLRKKGFFVQDTSFSNYYTTHQSLKSTLNMDLHTKREIYDNLTFYYLKQLGYKITSVKSLLNVSAEIKNTDKYIHYGLIEFERNLFEHTFIRNLVAKNIYDYTIFQLNSIDKLSDEKGKNFNFIHIISPHHPFVFNQDGTKVKNIPRNYLEWEPQEMYINQLIYLSKAIDEKIETIIKKDPNVIILLQSDHGPYIRNKDKESIFEARSMILNAVYGPKELKQKMEQTNTSVNTFIHLFNHLLNENIAVENDELIGKKDILENENLTKYLID